MTDHIQPFRPLEGVRVLDLTRVLAGPFCTQILGDLGADVIKLEEPGEGDQVRTIAPYYEGGESHYFMAINRNKKSLVVDLKSDEGREIALDLASRADVVMENFRPGVMQRLGLGLEALSEVRSDIILVSISGFGQEGPLSGAPCFDLVTQARSGVMSITGEANGPPTKLGLPMGDLGGGLWAAIAVLSALQGRARHAGPQHIDISMLDGLVGLLGYLGQLAILTGESPERVGSSHHNVVPYGRFDVKDGHIVLALHVGPFWRRFCRAVGREELIFDERFRTTDDRRENRDLLVPIVEAILREKTRAEWEEVLTEADVPHGPIFDVVEAFQQPQLRERGLFQQFQHPTAGQVEVVGSPIRHAGETSLPPPTPPPLYGQHTREVLTDLLGYEPDFVEKLLQQGVVATTAESSERKKT